jgi:hypothetical protein
MESRIYTIFKLGSRGDLWGNEKIIGPADESIVFQAFVRYFLKYKIDNYERCIMFASPVTLGQEIIGTAMIKYCCCEDKLRLFNKERILRALSGKNEPFEFIEEDNVKFERVFIPARI